MPYRECLDIVIPVYNAGDLLAGCWISLLETLRVPHRIYLGDDCSVEEDAQQILQQIADSGKACVTHNTEQLGFGPNCNAIAARGQGDIICFLNADTIATPGWDLAIRQEFSNPQVGIVGAKLIYPAARADRANTIQHAGIARNRHGDPYHIYRKLPMDYPRANRRLEINAVTGACLAIRRDIFESIDGFDTRYIGGNYEDVDLCWTVRDLGYLVVYQPAAVLYHYEHGSGLEWTNAYASPNRQRLFDKWGNLGSDEYLFGEATTIFDNTDLSP